jgi:replicative DNA helicase
MFESSPSTSERIATPHANPSNVEAEQAVLGSLLFDPDAIVQVAHILKPPDFYLEKHSWIYEVIVHLHEMREPIDLLSVVSALESRGRLNDVGGAAYLTSLMNAVPTAAHVEHYSRLVERASLQRRLLHASTEIAQVALDGESDADTLIEHAEKVVFEVAQNRQTREWKSMDQAVTEFYDHIRYQDEHRGEPSGVQTNLTQLNKLLGGLQKSDLIVVAGRPGSGKTSFGLSIAHHAAIKKKKVVALFSLEMSAEQLAQRLVSAESNVDSHRLRLGELNDDEWSRVVTAAGVLAESQIYVDDSPILTPLELRAKTRRLKIEHGLDLVVLDYMQLMSGSTLSRSESNRVQEMSYISRQLKALARDLEVPVLALSQLSRAVEVRPDKRPQLSDLRESGSIEQDADIVILIYRDKNYFPTLESWQKAHPTKEYPEHIAEINVAKHRHGPTLSIQVYFSEQQARFADLDLVPRER